MLLLAAGLALRLALWWVAADRPIRIDDEKEYDAIAMNLVELHEYSVRGVTTSIRPPLYPFFLAGCYELFGVHSFGAVRLIQALMGLATTVVVYRLGMSLYGRRVALLAAAWVCFYPALLGAGNFILTESLFTLLLAMSIWSLRSAIERDSLWLFAVTGLVIGLGALTRSVLWLLPPVLAMALMFLSGTSAPRRVAAIASMLLAFTATLAPWSIRNSRLHETFVLVDVMGGRNFMMGNYEFTPMFRAWDAISIQGEQSWDNVLRKQYPPGHSFTQGQLDKAAMKAGLEFVEANPGLTVQRDAVKFLAFWQLERELIAEYSAGYFGSSSKLMLLALTLIVFATYAATLLSALFGILVVPPTDKRFHVLVILTMAVICGAHTLVFGHSRYHLPLVPLLCIYSAAAVVHRTTLFDKWRSGAFAFASAACLLFVASWCYEVFVLDLQRFRDAMSGGA